MLLGIRRYCALKLRPMAGVSYTAATGPSCLGGLPEQQGNCPCSASALPPAQLASSSLANSEPGRLSAPLGPALVMASLSIRTLTAGQQGAVEEDRSK